MMSMQNIDAPRIAVIGGGAAGLMAAGAAAEYGARVTVFEPNAKLGRKLRITGKGRCNVTNNCTPEEFMSNVTRNPRFLYAALAAFSPADTMTFFEEHGVALKTERGRRVFPLSDSADDIAEALAHYAADAAVKREKVIGILSENGRVSGIRTAKGDYPFAAVILATGGCSYPLTGSDGSGHDLAASLGHTVTPLLPSLVPLVSDDTVCREAMGLSLRNVGLCIVKKTGGKPLYEDMGEMLFTHFGLSGPMILSASAHLRNCELSNLCAEIDLKPALDEKTLDKRLCSDFEKYSNRDFLHALDDLLPNRLITPFLERTGIDVRKKVHSVTREERRTILTLLKHFRISLKGFRPIEEAIVTSGGIHVKEVDPKTMMSRLVDGLYFAGEILDVDAYTGGYNLQIAFSTGRVAGMSAAQDSYSN